MRSFSRRRFLGLAGATAVGVSTAGCVGAIPFFPADTPFPDGPTVGLQEVATGMTAPVGVEFPPGSTTGYAVDQAGQVWTIDADGRREDPFLDVSDRMVSIGGGYSERGLLGLAFHPDYRENGRFYVRYSAPRREGTPENYSHTFVLSEFRADGDTADPDSERVVLEVPEPQSNHNAGSIAFGPDGYLYVGVGDGGAGGDQGTGHVEDWYDANSGGNGQDVTENLLGSILRIDVNSRDGDRAYGIPEDNPLVGREGLDEHYAWGFRNPWRFSFDVPEDGDPRLFVADVGQSAYEEVSVVEAGGNYGWNVREGAHCYGADDCPTETPDGDPLLDPIVEYPHQRDGRTVGSAVVGGHFYRNDAVPELSGSYVFGDWSSSFGSPQGSLFAATPPDSPDGDWSMSELSVAGEEKGELGRFVLGFGQDRDGEVYVCTTGQGGVSGSSGAVHRIVAPGDGSTGGTGTTVSDGATNSAGGETATTTGDGTATGSTTGTTSDSTGTTSPQSTPGFGTLATLAGLGAGAAWIRRRRER